MPSPPPSPVRRHRRTLLELGLHEYISMLCRYSTLAIIVALSAFLIVNLDTDLRRALLAGWRAVQLAYHFVAGAASVLGSAASLGTRAWCYLPGPRWGCEPASYYEPITLELAAHRVKHTAVTSLDVFESFARGMQASLSDRVSYIDLWAMSDAVSIMGDVPDGPRLATSLTELKDVVMKVEDGVSEINRVGWHSFSSIDRWIVRVRDAIVTMRASGRVDERELHKLLAQLSTSSRANVDELIRLIDRTLILANTGLSTASDVRRYALTSGADMQRRLAERSLPRRVWEAGSHAVKVTKRNVRSIQHIYDATNDVQAQLSMVRRYLVDYQANAANFHSEINSLEILTLEQELRELEHIGRKIEHVLQEAKRVNRDAFEKSARPLDA